jgi:hypothetical protein
VVIDGLPRISTAKEVIMNLVLHSAENSLDTLYTPSYSCVAQPINDSEQGGFISPFHWHCGLPMRKVIDKGSGAFKSHVCLFCQRRKYPPMYTK